MMNIIATFLSALAITGASILTYLMSSVMGIKSPELVVFAALTLALSLEYKNKLLKDNK